MTTPAEALKEYERKPFTLWDLKGKEFTIIESQPTNKNMRETSEINKWNKSQAFFFIKIEQGLFQKDLKMTENEMLAVFCALPKGISDYQGSMLSVDRDNKMGIKYLGRTNQDLQGNRIGDTQSPMPMLHQPQQQDQRDIFLTKLINSIRVLDELGNKVDAAYVMKICENISPGKALDLFQYAKTKGVIREENGAYKVN